MWACHVRMKALTHALVLLLLLLLEHMLLGLQVRKRMRVGSARLHAHHGPGLTDGATRARYTLMHHALLHGVARAGSSHDVTLLHLHASLGRKGTLHHPVCASCQNRPLVVTLEDAR